MRMVRALVSLALGMVVVVGCSSAATENDSSVGSDLDARPAAVRQTGKASATKAPSPLIDHSGPVLLHSNTYAIFWGPSSSFPSDEVAGVRAVLGGFDNSAYLGVANQYMRGTGTASSTYVSTGEKYLSSAPPAHAPRASDLGAQVCALYGTPDPEGIYFFFTSNYPSINYCAWHDKATCNGVTFQVAYMPNMDGVAGCSPFKIENLDCNTYSAATQSLLDGMAHEFMEATTDPHIDAWYDKSGQEIGDKCNFVYGTCTPLSNGTSWQIQQEWSNAIGGCAQQ
jgi:hypothetical protein